jgi:hypothetical protein
MAVANAAWDAFLGEIGNELLLGQVLIRRRGRGFELRHLTDHDAPAERLRPIAETDLRDLVQFTATGAFRPLKSAPNLPSGWTLQVPDAPRLEWALNQCYPGAIADWHAARSESPPVTGFREFTGRQTGMYRITAGLSDEQAALVIRAGCHKEHCLKRRLWSGGNLGMDSAEAKSIIPCLEPCALLLEFARKCMRIEQAEQQRPLTLSSEDAATIVSAIERALEQSEPGLREADFNAPGNPRRLRRVLEKLRCALQESL